jgi:hypothetical protein
MCALMLEAAAWEHGSTASMPARRGGWSDVRRLRCATAERADVPDSLIEACDRLRIALRRRDRSHSSGVRVLVRLSRPPGQDRRRLRSRTGEIYLVVQGSGADSRVLAESSQEASPGLMTLGVVIADRSDLVPQTGNGRITVILME